MFFVKFEAICIITTPVWLVDMIVALNREPGNGKNILAFRKTVLGNMVTHT